MADTEISSATMSLQQLKSALVLELSQMGVPARLILKHRAGKYRADTATLVSMIGAAAWRYPPSLLVYSIS
jgi:hypothetical protein